MFFRAHFGCQHLVKDAENDVPWDAGVMECDRDPSRSVASSVLVAELFKHVGKYR